MVGSCATLVTERIIQKAPQILDQQLAQLLYVVLDCVNMAPAAGKVTPKDSQYVAVLETQFPTMPPRGTLFQALQNAKFDVSGLNMEQMLLKDIKAVSGSLNVAVPVLYITLKVLDESVTLGMKKISKSSSTQNLIQAPSRSKVAAEALDSKNIQDMELKEEWQDDGFPSVTLSQRDSHDTNNDSFSAAALSGTPDETPSLDINLEALETPSDSETGTLPDSMHDLEWEGTLDLMVSENYVLVYLCAMAPRNKLPAIKWLNQCYTSIDRRYDGFYQQGPLANGAISQIFN
ncbi:hypothetical protein XENOCAPTIV_025571 [Xenoophorus captivus]|uniref:Uncharacterized protein n=1 Tax=Xenoophorus captivus TaxID=1517983 RepID=A0ABV0RFA1_9TELE